MVDEVGLVLMIVAAISDDLQVGGVIWTIVAAIVLSLVTTILRKVFDADKPAARHA